MARGFGTGLLHGAVVGVIALAGVSLLWPVADLPQGEGAPARMDTPVLPDVQPDTVPEPVQDVAADSGAVAPMPAPLAPAAAGDEGRADQPPRAEILDTPAGSEFGRASDESPKTPQPLTPVIAHAGASDSGPMVAAPADQAMSAPARAPAGRPATIVDTPATAPGMLGDIAAPDLPALPDAEGQAPIGTAALTGDRAAPPPLDAPPLATADLPVHMPDLGGLPPDLTQLSSHPAGPGNGAGAAPADDPHIRPAGQDHDLPAPDLSVPPAAGVAGFI